MADDDNFFALAPSDGAPPAGDAPIVLGDAPPSSEGDLFGAAAPASTEDAHIGDVNETDNAFAEAPSGDDNVFALPPAEAASGDEPIVLGGAPDDAAAADALTEEATPPVDTGPSPMQKWNDEWQETLKTRKDEENTKKAEMLEASKIALENFQKEREMKRENKMAKNREDEQAKLEAIEADLENDNSWQRVCKMVELSHDSTDESEDVKRMRDALIYLKNDAARAEVLGS